MLLWSAAIVAAAQQPASPVPVAAPASDMAPVVVDGITLFSVRGASAYPAEKRAQEIVDRIVAVAQNPAIATNTLRLEEQPDATYIMAGGRRITAVVDADAVPEGISRKVLAQVLLSRITEAIDTFRRERAPAVLVKHALYALAATILLAVAIYVARRIRRRTRLNVAARYRDRIRGVRIQSFQIIGTEQLWRAFKGVEQLLWLSVLLTACFVYLEFVLSLFPWTQGLANNLFSVLITPLRTMGVGLLQFIPNLVFLLVLFVVTRYLLMLMRLVFAAVENGAITLGDFDRAWAQPTYRLVRAGVIAFALVVAYPYIPGSSSQAFKGISLFAGVLLSLGSTSLIGNIIAGYTLTYRRTFKIGDRVKIGEHVGIVDQARVMATFLRTFKNELVVVPNSKVISEEVINYSALAQRGGVILHTTVGIGYDVPWRQVEAMLLEAAARTTGLMREPRPFILQTTLGDFAVTYEINGYCDQPLRLGVICTELHRNILDTFNEYGVQIMTPAYESDPDSAKVVDRDRWYATPARTPGSSKAS
jgi:small-conductance mechanosensitive channel